MSSGEDKQDGAGKNRPAGLCAACNYKRRRCTDECILAPHFPASDPGRYQRVHRLFGRFNLAEMLQKLPAEQRAPAADSFAVEAQWRAEDRVHGSAGVVHRLQEQICAVQSELARTQALIDMHAQANYHHLQMQQQQEELDAFISEFLDL